MDIISIIDNISSENKSLINEHGLSIYIKGRHNNVLFDFGQGSNTLENFINLNLDPSEIDKAVISHNHYDHGNGLIAFTPYLKNKKLIVGDNFFKEKYSKSRSTYTYLGSNFSQDYLFENQITLEVCRDIYKIDEEIFVLGNFLAGKSKFKINPRFYIYEEGQYQIDDFRDEVALVIKKDSSLSVILGCSHPGVILMLKHIEKSFKLPIKNVFGGSHLVESSLEEIEEVGRELENLRVENIYFSHCSGKKALEVFENIESINASPLYTGSKIKL